MTDTQMREIIERCVGVLEWALPALLIAFTLLLCVTVAVRICWAVQDARERRRHAQRRRRAAHRRAQRDAGIKHDTQI